MWKVRSSLAWRMARDFSRRSSSPLKSDTRQSEGNPLPYSHLHQKELNVTKKEGRKASSSKAGQRQLPGLPPSHTLLG